MEVLLERLEERIGLPRADLLGLTIALAGCIVATVVALRVPLLAQLDGGRLEPAPTIGASPGTGPADPVGAPLLVHVAGAVHTPGVVQLRAGDRVADALAAAGGPTVDAALASLNLARPLVDGEQVLVLTLTEAVAAAPGGEGGAGEGAGAVLPDGRLDLNSATAAELEELPRVGPVLAERIIAHRDQHGPFADPAELREVSGIGEATWASLRDLVGVR